MSDKYINPQGLQTIKTWVENQIPTATSDLTNDSNFITANDLVDGSTMTFVSYQTNEVATWENDTSIFPTGGGGGDSLPDQSGHSGEFLTTNGTTARWDDVPVPTKTSDLVNDSNFVVDASYVHTDNNFTSTLKSKLDGIATGAEVNVNADWNASSGDAQILNKPSIPSGSSTSPKMDGTATVGTETTWAHGDHIHPSDTNKQDKITANGILKGNGSGTISAAVAGTDYQSPLTAGTDYQTPLVAGTDYQTPLPSQSGNSGKFLTTNGSAMSWGNVPSDSNKQDKITASGILKGNGSGTITAAVAGTDYQTPLTAGTDYQTPLPTQTGNSGKFLTTDGTDLSWATASAGSDDIFVAVYGTTTSAEIETAWQAGKLVYCQYGNYKYNCAYRSSSTIHIFCTWYNNTKYYASCNNDSWSNSTSAFAYLASPEFTGTPKAPTATAGTNTTQIATTAFVQTATSGVIPSQTDNSGKFLTTDGSNLSWGTPSGGGDSNIFVATYGTTTTADIEAAYQAGKLIYCIYSSRLYTYGYRSSATAHYFYAWQGNTKYYIYTSSTATWSNSSTSMAPTASPSLTGSPTATTATAGTNSTRIATTAFVTTAISNAITAALAGGY